MVWRVRCLFTCLLSAVFYALLFTALQMTMMMTVPRRLQGREKRQKGDNVMNSNAYNKFRTIFAHIVLIILSFMCLFFFYILIVNAEKYVHNAAEQPDTIKLLIIPRTIGKVPSFATFLKFVKKWLPGSAENPFCRSA